MSFANLLIAHARASQRLDRLTQCNADKQTLAGARNLWLLAERRLRLTVDRRIVVSGKID
jgi:hypothetical protein